MSNRLKENLVGHWRLNSSTEDVSSGSNDGTWTGTETYDINIFRKSCASLDGSSSITHASVATDSVCYWYNDDFYTVTHQSTTPVYYKNAEVTTSFTVLSTATTIGASITGKMWDVRHFDVDLTADEVNTLFVSPPPYQSEPSNLPVVRDNLKCWTLIAGHKDLTQQNTILNYGTTGDGFEGDGTSGYLSFSGTPSFENDTYGCVFASVLLKREHTTETSDYILIVGGDSTSLPGLLFLSFNRTFATDSKTHFAIYQRSDGGTLHRVQGASIIDPFKWYRVCFVSTGSEWKIYVNGEEETIVPVSGSPNSGNWFGDTSITSGKMTGIGGGYYNSGYLYSNIDIKDLEVINEVLTDQAIYDDYIKAKRFF